MGSLYLQNVQHMNSVMSMICQTHEHCKDNLLWQSFKSFSDSVKVLYLLEQTPSLELWWNVMLIFLLSVLLWWRNIFCILWCKYEYYGDVENVIIYLHNNVTHVLINMIKWQQGLTLRLTQGKEICDRGK